MKRQAPTSATKRTCFYGWVALEALQRDPLTLGALALVEVNQRGEFTSGKEMEETLSVICFLFARVPTLCFQVL